MKPLTHRLELDGLRGIAILSVMLGHCSAIGFKSDESALGSALPFSASGLLQGGVLGVDIFFVLSGFLITTLLLQEYQQTGRIKLVKFYIRRILRLCPALILLLIFCSLYHSFFQEAGSVFGYRAILVTLTYLTNLSGLFHTPMGMLAHTWSLAVEEQFYIIWPWMLLLLIRPSSKYVCSVILLAAIASAILRFVLWKYAGSTGAASLPARSDAILLGSLVAFIVQREVFACQSILSFLAGFSAVSLIGMLVFFEGTSPRALFCGGYFLMAAITAILILGLSVYPPTWLYRTLTIKPLIYTGRISYGLYLYHFPIFCLLPWKLWSFSESFLTAVISAVIAFLLSYLVATLSYIFVEKKFLVYKQSFASGTH